MSKESKSYLVKASFMLKGEMFDFNSEDQLKNEIETVINDIAIDFDQVDDEQYDECYMDEVLNVTVEIQEFSYKIVPLPFCEHCGENHEEFGLQFFDGGTHWCLDCFNSGNDISDEQYNAYIEEEKQAHLKYLEDKLKKLKKK